MSATQWLELLVEPAGLNDEVSVARWFAELARRALLGAQLVVARVPHRITEVEAYYYGEPHLDPFTHREPIQRSTGLWYFHRTKGAYRGGSFKGLDLTFGGSESLGGLLIRGIEQEGGPLIDGPSLCVDHLLATTGAGGVAALDRAIGGRPAWQRDNPLRLEWRPELADRKVLSTARVGLSLKQMQKSDLPLQYIMRRYRYLTEPRRISKGKQHMVLALHADGAAPELICQQTGCTRAAVDRYIAGYEEGKMEGDLGAFFGIDLGPREIARLHGVLQAKHGREGGGPHQGDAAAGERGPRGDPAQPW